MDVYEEKAATYCNETYGERDTLVDHEMEVWDALYDAHIVGQKAANGELESETEEDMEDIDADLEDNKKKYEGKYFKHTDDSIRTFKHIKEIYNDCGDFCVIYDELYVKDYKEVSFISDIERYLFEMDLDTEIPKEEWVSEMCYYFKRIPGEDICCPE